VQLSLNPKLAEAKPGQAASLLLDVNVVLDVLLDRKAVGSRMARDTTDALLSVFGVASVDGAVLKTALALGWNDFEDAVTAAAARRAPV
jgi:hypothetical protein